MIKSLAHLKELLVCVTNLRRMSGCLIKRNNIKLRYSQTGESLEVYVFPSTSSILLNFNESAISNPYISHENFLNFYSIYDLMPNKMEL